MIKWLKSWTGSVESGDFICFGFLLSSDSATLDFWKWEITIYRDVF